MTGWGLKQSNRIATRVSRRRILQGAAGVVLVSAASGSASADSDSVVEYRGPDSRPVWQGQRIFAFGSGIEADTTYQLRRVTAKHDDTVTESEFLRELAAVAAEDIETTFRSATIEEFDLEAVGDVIEIQTGDLSIDDYFVRGGSLAGAGDLPLAETLEIIRQQLAVSFDPERIKQGQTTTLEMESNRMSFELFVGAETLTAATLERMFVEDGGFELAATQPTDDRLRIHGHRSISEAVVAADIEPGEYALTFQAADTTATASATLTVEAESPIEELVWHGQTVILDDDRIESNTAYEIREVEETIDGQVDQSSFVLEVLADDHGEITVETASLSTGKHFISGGAFPTNPELTETFEIIRQQLAVGFDPERIKQGQTTTLEMESNRRAFELFVGAETLTAATLERMFVEDGGFELAATQPTDDRLRIHAEQGLSEAVVAADIEPGGYALTFQAVETTATASATLIVQGETGTPLEELVWQGQTVISDDGRIEPNTAYEIREVEEVLDGQVNQSSFVLEVLADDHGEITVETASLSTGKHFISGGAFPTNPELTETFEIVAQRFGVTIEPTDLLADETATLAFESNRAEYSVVVTADGELNTDQLLAVLVENGGFRLLDDYGTADSIEIEASNTTGEITADGLPVGTYALSFTVPDTGVKETVTITIEDDDESTDDDEASVADYAAADGRVETPELRVAIDDWRTGDIGTSLLRSVIDAWRSGDVVV